MTSASSLTFVQLSDAVVQINPGYLVIPWSNNSFVAEIILSFNFHQCFERGSGWTGDLLVADAEELKNNTTSEVGVQSFKEKNREFR